MQEIRRLPKTQPLLNSITQPVISDTIVIPERRLLFEVELRFLNLITCRRSPPQSECFFGHYPFLCCCLTPYSIILSQLFPPLSHRMTFARTPLDRRFNLSLSRVFPLYLLASLIRFYNTTEKGCKKWGSMQSNTFCVAIYLNVIANNMLETTLINF